MPRPEIAGLATKDTPSLSRARELFGLVINGHGGPVSTPSSIADRIEQRVCVSPHTFRPITEGMLSHEFLIGRRMARQTSRILQLRGILEPRRGGNGLGGLWVVAPSLDQALAAVSVEVRLDGSDDLLAEAKKCLVPAVADRNDALALLVCSLLHPGTFRQTAGSAHGQPDSQANWLADRLRDEIVRSPNGDVPLGTLADISDEFAVSQEVAVEAVRILADAQLVEVRRGRNGGVFSRAPRAGPALHITNAYLASNSIPTAACREVLGRINTGMIELARQRRTAVGLESVRQSFHQMQHAAKATELGKAWYGFIRDIGDMADNPLLHFMARALASSILMRRTKSAELPDAAARELLAASSQILRHLENETAAPIVDAQSRCQQALENYW